MGATYPTKLQLAFRSGDRCAFPGCDKALVVQGASSGMAVVGVAAHIAGENEGAARYDGSMTDTERDGYSNLIYLCGTHHTEIDGLPSEYTVERLHAMKEEHENRVREGVADALSTVGFAELEEATDWILQIPPGGLGGDFLVVPPDEKIRKNELSTRERAVITMGLSVAREVRAYIQSMAQTDSEFAERLKAGFLEEYFRLRREGLSGDELFDLMCRFAQRGFRDHSRRSAGIAVLVYLFEACEVFER